MRASLFAPVRETTVRCRVAAWGSLRARGEVIAQWRKQPVVIGNEKLPVSFLKHSEDQTVLALAAVRAGLEREGWQHHRFTDWGVIAAPNLFGRITHANTLQRYRQEGAWGVAPNLIPHQSLHAVSGTISQALKIHGPNFGISSAPNASLDAFLIAAAMLMDRQLPGLWVVLTGYESELIPAADGPTPAPDCQAVALALTPLDGDAAGLHLSIGHACDAEPQDIALLPEPSVGLIADELTNAAGCRWRLADSHWLELETVLDTRGGRS